MSPVGAAGDGWARRLPPVVADGFALLALGGGDYALQRWRLMKSLKMSVQDVKDEAQAERRRPGNEGQSPQDAARDDPAAHDGGRGAEAPRSSSPTRRTLPSRSNTTARRARPPSWSPRAKTWWPLRIREIARQHSVPIIENPPLARALFKECDLGDTIPGPLFNAVAEVLAYLIRIKQLAI